MSDAAMKWALRQNVRCAPTKLMLVALASRYVQGIPLRATRELITDVARVASIRRAGFRQRLFQLVEAGVVELRNEGTEIHLLTGRG